MGANWQFERQDFLKIGKYIKQKACSEELIIIIICFDQRWKFVTWKLVLISVNVINTAIITTILIQL